MVSTNLTTDILELKLEFMKEYIGVLSAVVNNDPNAGRELNSFQSVHYEQLESMDLI